MVDPDSGEFKSIYHQFVELVLDYGTDTDGSMLENAVVPIPVDLAFEIMDLNGDLLSRLAAVSTVTMKLKKLVPPTGSDRGLLTTLERILDPTNDPVEYLKKLESWATRH